MIIGIGTDITRIDRFSDNYLNLAKRILTEKEYTLFETYKNKERKIEFLAGRFAAKEAILKALDKEINFSSIEILFNETGKPVCHIDGYKVHISISHEKEYAIAYSVVEVNK